MHGVWNFGILWNQDYAVKLYQTDTRILKQSVKRNIEKFWADFMIEFDEFEIQSLVSQSVIASKKYLG